MSNSEKSDNQSHSEFWSTLPGILTGVAGIIGAMTALILGLKEVGLIGQDSTSVAVSPSTPASTIPSPTWEFMGFASTGEGVSVSVNSVNRLDGSVDFDYKVGDELISASADCDGNQWYTKDYGWYSPRSEATQKMMNFVCKS